MHTLESAVLSAWYCSRPQICRLLATRDTEGLRVLVQLDPALDADEGERVWKANRHEWADDLQWHTCTPVRLEHADERLAEEAERRGAVVADLSWRDPSRIGQITPLRFPQSGWA
jgi:hypothetical protein